MHGHLPIPDAGSHLAILQRVLVRLLQHLLLQPQVLAQRPSLLQWGAWVQHGLNGEGLHEAVETFEELWADAGSC